MFPLLRWLQCVTQSLHAFRRSTIIDATLLRAPAATAAPDASPDSDTTSLYRNLWRFARGARLQYCAAMALLGFSVAVKLFIPWLAAEAINIVQSSGWDRLGQAGWYIAAVFALHILSWTMHGPARVLERNVGVRVRAQVADALYAKLTSLPLTWHEQHHSGDAQQRVQQASRALFDFTQSQFMYVQCLINIIGPIVALWLVAGWVGALAFAGYAAIAFVIVRFDRALMRHARAENQAERRYASRLLDFLGNISTVLALRQQAASRALLAQRMDDVFKPLKRSIVINEAKWCSVDLLSAGLVWMLVGAYAWMAHAQAAPGAGVAGAVMLGGLFMIYQYAQQAAGVIGTMASNFQSFARMRTDFASAAPIWEARATPEGQAHGATAPEAQAAGLEAPQARDMHDWSDIDALGLTYTYTRGDGAKGGVHGASLKLKRGEHVALIGPSGSGKSTLLRLLAGLYQPSHGYYQVDGQVRFGLRSLSAVATLVPQDAEVIEASVRDNLGFGVAQPEESIARAVKLSAFDEVLAGLPQGLDTLVAERGANLSGGQRQRLALARGFLAAG
ncbi:MAG TPA: ABC transporter ATP-binding protein, partial [Burkholderiales bacterium]|nr:ABC transporter ATP-binding protein [Burkholderiales bacterium]